MVPEIGNDYGHNYHGHNDCGHDNYGHNDYGQDDLLTIFLGSFHIQTIIVKSLSHTSLLPLNV